MIDWFRPRYFSFPTCISFQIEVQIFLLYLLIQGSSFWSILSRIFLDSSRPICKISKDSRFTAHPCMHALYVYISLMPLLGHLTLVKSDSAYTEKMTLLSKQNVLLIWPQPTKIVVVTISAVTTIIWIVITTITVVNVRSEIVTTTILICWGYINKPFS